MKRNLLRTGLTRLFLRTKKAAEKKRSNHLKATEGNFMLVLSRRINEKIRIGKEITVTIIRIDRGAVRIGIEAPENVHVKRENWQTTVKKTQDDNISPA